MYIIKKAKNDINCINDKTWVLQFCIPFEFMDKISGKHTNTIFGNLYKCGNETENKHFATYYPINTEEPDFHRPDFFGEFILE